MSVDTMLETMASSLMVPSWSILVAVFVFGTIFGSFLDVCVCRFHTGKSINGSSRCLSCGKRLHWYELFPLLSFLFQRGRCRGCGCKIDVRLFVMEVVTGGLFVVAASAASGLVEFGWLAVFLLVLLAITVYDYNHFIIPDELTIALLVLITGWLGYQWWSGLVTMETVLWTVGASVAGAAFFLFLWAVSKGRWLGFGDVKLAIPLGLWVGPGLVFSFIVLSFWVGAGLSVCLLVWQKYKRGKAGLHLSQETLTMKSAVPFAPFMIIGAALVYFFSIDVLSLFSFA